MPKNNLKFRPHRKGDNRYKFSSFTEQINSVSVSSVQRYHSVAPDPVDLSLGDDLLLDQPSFLRSGVEEQLLECQTQPFNRLIAQVQPHIGSYKEIVLHQRFIFSKLSKCISKADDFTLISVLRLVADFSRDIQSDFYAYFYELIEVLGSKLKTILMSKCLIAIFNCLTKVIKILLRTFVPEDMARFLVALSPFMESKKMVEVKFASGAFAFICKKLVSVETVTEILYQTMYPKVMKGYRMIVIEMVEGVGVEFNSLVSSFLHFLIEKLPVDNKWAVSFLKLTMKAVLEIVVKNEHAKTSGDGMKIVWNCVKQNALSIETTNMAVYSVLNELIKFQDGNLVRKQNLGNEIVETIASIKHHFENQMNLWYNLCGSIFDCLPLDELNPEIIESFKYECFEFNPSTWRLFVNFLTALLECDNNSLVQFDCVLNTIEVLQGAATHILVELNYDEVEMVSGIDARIEVLHLLVKLVIKTGCASKQNEFRELLNFAQNYLDNAEIIEELENAAFVLICKLAPADIFEAAQSEFHSLEQKLQVSKLMSGKISSARAQSIDQFLCYKVKFSYLLSRSRLAKENFSDLLERIHEDAEDVDTLVALFSNLSHFEAKELPNFDDVKKVCSLLLPNFRSYNSNVVQKTLEIFLCLNKCVHAENETCEDECPQHIFRKLYEIINIPDTYEALREKLVLCEKVSFQRISKVKVPEGSMITREELLDITISFLFSLCFSRFAPLQKEVVDILVNFQNGKLERLSMAKILSTLLKEAFLGGKSSNETSWDLKLMRPPENNYDELRSLIYESVAGSETISPAKKRMKLLDICKYDSRFAGLVMSSFRDCFYEFLMNDISRNDIGKNLRLAPLLSEIGIQPKGTCGPLEEGLSESHLKLLLAFLNVLTSVHKTRELKNDQKILAILYRFLRSAFIFVQKPALECLLSFQQPDLQPYMEYLQLLSNEKCVKKTLAMLKFSKENSIVSEVHREGVLQLLFPFMHGRLYNSKWLGTMQERFRSVFSFLKFLDDDRKEKFFLEVFEDFQILMASSNTDLFAFESFDDSLKTRMVLSFEQILDNFKNAHSFGIVKRCFRCILSIALSLSRAKNQNRMDLDSKKKRLLKQCSLSLLQFLETSPEPLTGDEMKAILDEIVKPALVFKPSQGFRGTKSTSVPLSLKFVEFFAKHPHYRKYLEYKIDARNESTVLECLCSVYLSTTAVKEHQYFTLNILMSLISESEDNESDTAPYEKEEEDSDREQDEESAVDDEEMDDAAVSGEQLLKSCSRNIVRFLQDKMLSGAFKSLPQLVKNSILKLLTLLIDEIDRPQDCVAIANTLSAFIAKRQTRYSLEMDTIGNIANLLYQLLRKCNNPVSVLLRLSTCLSENLPNTIRRKVCNIFSVISENFASILIGLNSWDEKAIDEPNFQLRFESFARVDSLLKELQPKQCVLAVSALYRNCCFFIHSVSDYGLRRKSVDCIKMVLNNYRLTRPLVKMMKFEITRLLKLKLEDANLINVVTVLTSLVQSGHEFDITLSELNQCLCENPDFITNLGQIQIQKRCKSLMKSVKLIASDHFDWNTIEFLFLPLAWNVLSSLEEENEKDPNLVNALIEILKVCANRMSIADLISYSEKCLHLVNRNRDNPKVPCRMFSAVLLAFGTNKAVVEWNSGVFDNQDDFVRSSLKSLAGKIYSVLASLKNTNKDCIDQNESNALIAKLPLYIGSINVSKTLPENVRHFHTKNVLLSLCGFLRSRDKAVRHATRGVLMEIILKLDKQYLNVLIEGLFSILDRGFRKDVLVFSLFRVLSEAKKVFKAGDIDIENIKQIAEFLCKDTFEAAGADRSATKLGAKTPEASKTYALPAYSALGFYATVESLPLLLQPLDEIMQAQCLDKSKNIVMQILRQLAVEILENNVLADLDILKFCEEVCTGNVAKILNRTENNAPQKKDPRLQPVDSLLLEPVPTRVVDRRPIVQTFMYHHVFLNFSLQLLLKFIQKIDVKSLKRPESLEILQKLVPSVQQGLSSSYIPVVIQSVRCLKELTSLPLQGVVTSENLDKINEISEKYCRGNAVSKQLQELIPVLANCTKIFLSDEDFEITERQLSLVLAHVEEDLGESSKVKASLDILQPIVFRRWKHENISSVMNLISKLIIQSEWPPNRVNCRNLYVDYLVHFVDKADKIDKCLNFFIAQISTYSVQTGRESALELLVLFVSKADSSYLNRIALKLFYPLCLVLANDSAETCCKLSSLCLAKLIGSVNDEVYQSMSQISFSWMKNREELSLIKLGCMVCEHLLENVSMRPEPKWRNILSILLETVQHCSAKQEANEVDGIELNVRQLDYTLCVIFRLIEIIVPKIDVNGNFHQFAELLPDLFKKICDHLTYSHEWVQILCCQILGKIFSAIPANDFLGSKFVKTVIFSSVKANSSADDSRADEKVDLFVSVVEKIFRNISYIAASDSLRQISLKVIVYLTLASISDFFNKKSTDLKLCTTIIVNVKELAWQETMYNFACFAKRRLVLNWANYVLQSKEFVECLTMEVELLDKVLEPIVKELTSKTTVERPADYTESLQRTFEKFEKTLVTDGLFLGRYSKLIQEMHQKRLENRSAMRKKALIDPESHSELKLKKGQQTIARRKRKIAERKGKINTLKPGLFGSKRAKTEDEIFFESLL